MIIFSGTTRDNFEYEYTFKSFEEFKKFTFEWVKLFPSNGCHGGLMVNTFEEN